MGPSSRVCRLLVESDVVVKVVFGASSDYRALQTYLGDMKGSAEPQLLVDCQALYQTLTK